MAEEIFSTSSNLNLNNIGLDVSGVLDGQSLVYDGTSFVPADIVPVGTIEAWAGTTTPPSGWLLCGGQAESRTTYARLFNQISTSFGSGDGFSTFNVPNMQLNVPVGIAGGGTRGTTTISAANASHSHNHTVSGEFTSGDQSDVQSHFHATSAMNNHTHSLNAANNSHSHGSDGVSSNHRHNYVYGNPTSSGTTGSSAHSTHNGISGVNQNMGGHTHSLANNTTIHEHSLDSTTTSHQHSSWNGDGLTSNSATVSHSHTINTQRIYFIIKH
jgi:microcystin-dependent protein